MNFKKFSALILIIVLLISSTTLIHADDSIKVTVNGELIDFDVAPTIINERTLVPIRAIFESLGATVEWNGETRTVIGRKGNITIELPIDSKISRKNGVDIELDVPATILNERTFVPARFIAESMGANVTWDDSTRTVIITSSSSNNPSVVNLNVKEGTANFSYYKEANNLASSIEISNNDFTDEFNNLTFIKHTSDYINTYSNIHLAKVQNNEIREMLIHSNDKPFSFIKNLKANEDWGIWTVLYLENNNYYTDIYAYNFSNSKKIIVKEKLESSLNNGYINVFANLYNNYVSWIEHDKEAQKTNIVLYDLETENKKVVASFDFLETASIPFPVYFLNMKDGKIIFDVKKENGEYSYHIYDVENLDIDKKLSVKNNAILHFSADYDSSTNLLGVYFLTSKGEEVGYVDLNNGEYNKIFNLFEYDNLYKDRLQMDDGYMLFNIQRNVSGQVFDHYIGYLININEKSSLKFPGSIEIKKKGKYITKLSLDENYQINKTNVEIINIKNIENSSAIH